MNLKNFAILNFQMSPKKQQFKKQWILIIVLLKDALLLFQEQMKQIMSSLKGKM